jgi:hypothetical protein
MPATAGSITTDIANIARAAVGIAAAVLIALPGLRLLALDRSVGPAAQRVNIRWTAATAADPGIARRTPSG